MRQVFGLTSTYSSDEFGVCSALYELGGMVVMHDASGCNSTYTTHDEPRWYNMDSMVYISAISEMEAIMGDDEKFIQDLIETAGQLKPRFIALVGAPIPYMIGTDMAAIAQIVEDATGIPSFGFDANGMQYYTLGVSWALERMVDHFCQDKLEKDTDLIRVNLLGATPLDFFLNGSVEAMKQWLEASGFEAGISFAMGCDLEDVAALSKADVNLVVSYGGLQAAKLLKQRFGIPYICGVPFGTYEAARLVEEILNTVEQNRETTMVPETGTRVKNLVLIGESITSVSLARELEAVYPQWRVQVCCPLDTASGILRSGDLVTPEEDDLIRAIQNADAVLADPLYQAIAADKPFYPLPHLAFSGRMYEKTAPNLINRDVKKEIQLC